MRICLTLGTHQGELSVPIQYNEYIQAFLYSHLDRHLAARLHDEGIADPVGQRRLKFFTFSRLLGKWRVFKEKMIFSDPVKLVVASPMADFLRSLATHLISQRSLSLGSHELCLEALEIEPPLRAQRPILVQALSPITVYSTLFTAEGKRKTYYYSPWEQEFEALLLKNLQRKARVWYGSQTGGGGHIRPFKVSPRDEHIVKFKGTVIKAWTGIYELDLPREYLEMAYYAGLGAKNSQGFGCLALWESAVKDLAPRLRSQKRDKT